MKITMENYEGKEVTFEVQTSKELEVLERYLDACCHSGDRDQLIQWGVMEGENDE